MQLFKTFNEAEAFLENLETDLDRIDGLDFLILELEERTLAYNAEDSINSSMDLSQSLSSIEQWNSILPALKRFRRDLMKIHFEEFEKRFERSFPPGRRLRFPVSSSEKELQKNIRVMDPRNSSRIHEYLVWLLGVLEKDEITGGWILREEETWRLVLDWRDEKEDQEEDWGEALWKVLNITDEFIEYLKVEEGLYFRSAMTNSVEIGKENTSKGTQTNFGPRELIPWLGSKKQLQTLLELLYQNQIISNPDVDSMIPAHFWDAKNQKRYGSPKPCSDDSPDMIPWTGTQAQLKKLFYLLANDVKGRLLEWGDIRHTKICEHFFNPNKQQLFKPENLKKIDFPHYSQSKLKLIHDILEKASEA